MDPDLEQKIQNIQQIVEENNKMLHKVRGVQKRQAFWGVLKVLFFIGIALGAFYFLEPYIANISKFLSDTGTTLNSIKNILPQ